MVVPLTLKADPEISAAKALFQTNIVAGGTVVGGGVHHQYDVSLDGEQFLMVTGGDLRETPINIVVNWPATVK